MTESDLLTTEQIGNLGAPPGWKPKCKTIQCYIKYQHPSVKEPFGVTPTYEFLTRPRFKRGGVVADYEIRATGWEWKRACLRSWYLSFKYTVKQIIRPDYFEFYPEWNRTRWQNFKSACKGRFGLRGLWNQFWYEEPCQ